MTDNAQYFLISGGTGESKFKLIILMGSSFALPILVDSLKLQDMYRKQFRPYWNYAQQKYFVIHRQKYPWLLGIFEIQCYESKTGSSQ